MIDLDLTNPFIEINQIDHLPNLINTTERDPIVILLIVMIDTNKGKVLGLLMTDIDQDINHILINTEIIDNDLEVSKGLDTIVENIEMIDIKMMSVIENHIENILNLDIEMKCIICIEEIEHLKEEIMKKIEERNIEIQKINNLKMIDSIRRLIGIQRMKDLLEIDMINILARNIKILEEMAIREEKSLMVGDSRL